ncbi:MAG: hypothetical protein ACREJC_22205, partial [Tepidisphaeraceae bacterium]
PGSEHELRAGNVVLDLRHSSVVGTGPQGPSVTLTLALKLRVQKSRGSNAPLNYRVEVFASDDNGNRQGFDQAGTLRVPSKAKGKNTATAQRPIDTSDHEKRKAQKHHKLISLFNETGILE